MHHIGDFCFMEFTSEDFLYQIREYGSRNLDVRSMAIMLDLSPAQTRLFKAAFDNLESDIRHWWEKGKLDKQKEIEDKLEAHVTSGGEGAGDAARSLGYLQRKRHTDALKLDLFGI